jgi:mannose-6-phosphate isomerase
MSLSAYAAWVETALLPAWLPLIRLPGGLFTEKLRLNGDVDTGATLRLRTQFRQVYALAHAAEMGLLPRAAALAEAEAGVAALERTALSPDGRPGWAATFRPDGSIVDARRDLYDHAFVALGLGWLAQATGKARHRELLETTLAAIDTVLASRHGGWAEDDAHALPRRQNPHMHFFEASMALHELSGEARHLARAGEIFSLFRARFFDEARGFLLEFFDEDWSRLPDGGSEAFEPGHFVEWVWLLRRYERLTGAPVTRFCRRLLGAAERVGREPDGFLCDAMDGTGRRTLDRRRLWTQTEYLKALIVEAGKGLEEAGVRAEALAGRILSTYVADAGRPGLFIDQYDLAGRPSADHVPASIVYHLLAVVPEIRLFQATA